MIFKTINGDKGGTTILIRLSSKCSSNCKNCNLPYLEKNDFYSLDKLEDILIFSKEKCSYDFVIGILGFNLLDIDRYSNFYNLISKYNEFNYSIQLSLDDLFKRYKKIDFLLNKYYNISFGIQKIINKKNDLLLIIKAINLLLNESIKLNISFIVNFKIYRNFIELLKGKYKFKQNENFITFFIGKSIVEFENDLGFGNIEEFELNKCVGLNNFFIDNKNILISNDIEITLGGKIKFHLNNFCNQGIQIISNIYKNDIDIINDFRLLKGELLIRDLNKNKCVKCLENPINFSKYER